jgi:hypothetical protein
MVFVFVNLLFHKNKQNPTNNNVFSLFIFISTCRLRKQDVNESKGLGAMPSPLLSYCQAKSLT